MDSSATAQSVHYEQETKVIETPAAKLMAIRIKKLLESSVQIEGGTYYFYRDVEMFLPTEGDISLVQQEAIRTYKKTRPPKVKKNKKKRIGPIPRYKLRGGRGIWSPVFGTKDDKSKKPDPSKRVYGDPPGTSSTAKASQRTEPGP